MNNTIKLTKESILNNAVGSHTNGNTKPVLCLTTNERFTSVTDAAEAYSIDKTGISAACRGKLKTYKGKKWCFVSERDAHLNEILDARHNYTELERKAAAWDKLITELKKEKEEKEKRQAAIAKAEAKLEQRKRIVERIDNSLQLAVRRMMEAEKELADLKGSEGK